MFRVFRLYSVTLSMLMPFFMAIFSEGVLVKLIIENQRIEKVIVKGKISAFFSDPLLNLSAFIMILFIDSMIILSETLSNIFLVFRGLFRK
ncbi:hypothetical protein FLB_08470 [Flavobacterium succinicans]|uniref:Uncharacterized protein n=1 Tax=Flavobacterium succinicans TaxID=29536 RepID=A0A199XUK2_9FLAO|nr:hypothetical protein FLB_08470 [Flavobacterium succinicans]